jgi:hypothetical protein
VFLLGDIGVVFYFCGKTLEKDETPLKGVLGTKKTPSKSQGSNRFGVSYNHRIAIVGQHHSHGVQEYHDIATYHQHASHHDETLGVGVGECHPPTACS